MSVIHLVVLIRSKLSIWLTTQIPEKFQATIVLKKKRTPFLIMNKKLLQLLHSRSTKLREKKNEKKDRLYNACQYTGYIAVT